MARFTAARPLLELTAAGRVAVRLTNADEVDGNAMLAAATLLAPRKTRRETGSDMNDLPEYEAPGGATGI
jgi:hypothetical protein